MESDSDIGEHALLGLVVPADEAEVPAIKTDENAQAIELRLEDPVGMIEWLGDANEWHR